MSVHFLSRKGIEIGVNVTAGFSCGLAFATGFPVTLCSTFSREMVSDVSVTYLLIPFTIRTQETQRFDQDFNTVPFLMIFVFSCFRESTLSLGMLLHIEAMYTGCCIELVLFHWGVWQQKVPIRTHPSFCDSQVRSLYELKINEILQSAAKKVFYWLTCDTHTACQLCIPLILAVFFPPRWTCGSSS